jgi:chemotaxis protein MotA
VIVTVTVIVGAFDATIASFEVKVITNVFSAIMRAVFPKPLPDPKVSPERLVDYATWARHEGILSLESDAGQLDGPFMRKALQLATDGNDPTRWPT